MAARPFVLSSSLVLVAFWSATALAGAHMNPRDAAKQTDRLLSQEVFKGDSTGEKATRCDDATYLRRVYLDLVGKSPTPDEITAFSLDTAPDKRAKIVEQLLDSEDFGKNLARYWRDVIMYRRSEPRALIAAPALEQFLTAEFNKGTPWNEITRAFITATGDVKENGAAALIMAQEGKPEETTAEVARIFLGIQIQCAQCHDHPTDRWKREQFHEMAAFFPRLAVRRVNFNTPDRSFEVVSVNREPRFRGPMGTRGGSLEHYMPDLEDPSAKGTLMQPKFFAMNRTAEKGLSDEERRKLLGNWLASDHNPWFAKAFVNRVWAELVGEGFYEPVDDMGPDRQCSAPETMKFLGDQFGLERYNVKWLYTTIAATEAYQRGSRDRRTPEGTPFAANCPQPLRADQLLDNLMAALGISESAIGAGARPRGPYGLGGFRNLFAQTFGYDPSMPRDEVAWSIPQALFLMNSGAVNAAINARRGDTDLAELLRKVADDEAVVQELYLKSLAREPKRNEIQTCLEHVKSTGNRQEAFEDILWALVNSSEFIHRK